MVPISPCSPGVTSQKLRRQEKSSRAERSGGSKRGMIDELEGPLHAVPLNLKSNRHVRPRAPPPCRPHFSYISELIRRDTNCRETMTSGYWTSLAVGHHRRIYLRIRKQTGLVLAQSLSRFPGRVPIICPQKICTTKMNAYNLSTSWTLLRG